MKKKLIMIIQLWKLIISGKERKRKLKTIKTTMAGKGKRSETYNDTVVKVKGKRKEFALKT